MLVANNGIAGTGSSMRSLSSSMHASSIHSGSSKISPEALELTDSIKWLARHLSESLLEALIQKAQQQQQRYHQRNSSVLLKHDYDDNDGCDDDDDDDDDDDSVESFGLNSSSGHNQNLAEKPLIGRIARIQEVFTSASHNKKALTDGPNVKPWVVQHESALLFVDISGFTKLSTLLGVE